MPYFGQSQSNNENDLMRLYSLLFGREGSKIWGDSELARSRGGGGGGGNRGNISSGGVYTGGGLVGGGYGIPIVPPQRQLLPNINSLMGGLPPPQLPPQNTLLPRPF